MKRRFHIVALALIFSGLLLGIHSCAAKNTVNSAMTGRWEGNARTIVSWCHQTNLSVALDIQADGSVKGKTGDATLDAAHFQSHRTWPWGHTLITGNLNGPIVAADGITRSRVTMMCDFSSNSFNGQIDTDGSLCVFSSQKTMKEKMALTAVDLKLTRPKSNP